MTDAYDEGYLAGMQKMRNLARSRIEELAAELQEAASLLEFAVYVTGEPHCWHDHHGYCQAHNVQPAEECWVKKATDLVAKLKGKNQ